MLNDRDDQEDFLPARRGRCESWAASYENDSEERSEEAMLFVRRDGHRGEDEKKTNFPREWKFLKTKGDSN